jgi:predicted metal-dependent phosphoesterase TrpH
VAAVCDHDTQRSVAEASGSGRSEVVRVIPGVEMTTWWADRQWQPAVYGHRPRPDRSGRCGLERLSGRGRRDAPGRAADARDRYEAAGYPLPSLEEIRAGRPLWPFHVLSR